jgi:hypothetical protein
VGGRSSKVTSYKKPFKVIAAIPEALIHGTRNHMAMNKINKIITL